jgi:hypothetical protein
MNTNRIYYYDIVKCIASYLICLSHFGTIENDLLHNPAPFVYFNYFFLGIASVGVPIFLMTNGAFLLNKDYPLGKILHRAKSFAILYLIWGVVTLLVLAPLYHDQYTPSEFIIAVVKRKTGRTEHLWFMMAMVYIYLLFPFIKSLFAKPGKEYFKYLVVLTFLCTFGVRFCNDLLSTIGYLSGLQRLKNLDLRYILVFNPFNFWFAFTLVYFISGGVLARYLQTIRIKPLALWAYLLIGLSGLFLFSLSRIFFTGMDYDIVWSGHDTIMTMVMAFSLFILCSKIRLNNQKLITLSRVIGLNTLGIYFIHIPVGHWLTPLYNNLAISNYLVADIFYALLIMSISLGISLLIKQIPFVKRLVQIQ